MPRLERQASASVLTTVAHHVANVELVAKAKVTDVRHDDGGGFSLTFDRRGGREGELARGSAVVLATGSASHQLAARLGHEVSGGEGDDGGDDDDDEGGVVVMIAVVVVIMVVLVVMVALLLVM